jgi:transposase
MLQSHILGENRMPFQSNKAKLILSYEEISKLETITRSRTEPMSYVERAKILLGYHSGESISEIARSHNTNRPKVERQINKALQIGALPSLNDIPRSGRNNEITDEAKTWLVSLACSKPTDYGYANETWTTELLARHAREHCDQMGYTCLNKLSRGTVSKILSSNEIKPHKIRYYHERRDPMHEEKMNSVLMVYKEVETMLDNKNNVYAYISYDEKPGIQAIENTAPDLMPAPGKHAYISRDHEYIRHGTLSLLAGIDLTTGMITATVQERHRSVEFIEFLEKINQVYADKQKIKIILDNHSSHISKQTMAYLATKPNRFGFVFTPKHASWLNLIETFFGKLARTMLRGIRVKSKEELRDRILRHVDFLNQSPVVFRWKYKMNEIQYSL